MSASQIADYDTVLQAITAWPPEQRRALIEDVLKSLYPPENADERRRQALDRLEGLLARSEPEPGEHNTWERAQGLLKTDRPAPTDEEVKQWLEERRMQKYG
jgi:hypothetical protein